MHTYTEAVLVFPSMSGMGNFLLLFAPFLTSTPLGSLGLLASFCTLSNASSTSSPKYTTNYTPPSVHDAAGPFFYHEYHHQPQPLKTALIFDSMLAREERAI